MEKDEEKEMMLIIRVNKVQILEEIPTLCQECDKPQKDGNLWECKSSDAQEKCAIRKYLFKDKQLKKRRRKK